MSITADELREIVCNIWLTQLEMDLVPFDAISDDAVVMTGSIQIGGDWAGAVHVQCGEALIRDAAAVMFRSAPAQVNRRDLRDALGELTNMTAGNIKAMLPGHNHISLPSVTDGTDYAIVVLEASVVARECFVFGSDTMIVTVHKKN